MKPCCACRLWEGISTKRECVSISKRKKSLSHHCLALLSSTVLLSAELMPMAPRPTRSFQSLLPMNRENQKSGWDKLRAPASVHVAVVSHLTWHSMPDTILSPCCLGNKPPLWATYHTSSFTWPALLSINISLT